MAQVIELGSNDIGGDIGRALGTGFSQGLEERRLKEELALKQERARQLHNGIRNAPTKKDAIAIVGAEENRDLFEDISDYMAVSKEIDSMFEPDGSKKRTEVYKRNGDGTLSSAFVNVGEDPPEGFVTSDFLSQTRSEEERKEGRTKFEERGEDEKDDALFDIPDSEESAAAAAYLVNNGKFPNVESIDKTSLTKAIASQKAVKDNRTTLGKSFGLQVDPETGDILSTILGGEGSDGKEVDRFGIGQQVMQELTFEGMSEGRAYNAAIRAARAVLPEKGKPAPTITKVEDSDVEDNEAKFTPGQIYETPGYGTLIYVGKKGKDHNWVRVD